MRYRDLGSYNSEFSCIKISSEPELIIPVSQILPSIIILISSMRAKRKRKESKRDVNGSYVCVCVYMCMCTCTCVYVYVYVCVCEREI